MTRVRVIFKSLCYFNRKNEFESFQMSLSHFIHFKLWKKNWVVTPGLDPGTSHTPTLLMTRYSKPSHIEPVSLPGAISIFMDVNRCYWSLGNHENIQKKTPIQFNIKRENWPANCTPLSSLWASLLDSMMDTSSSSYLVQICKWNYPQQHSLHSANQCDCNIKENNYNNLMDHRVRLEPL